MTPERVKQDIEEFCEYMQKTIEKPELVMEAKGLVDELTVELANCAKDFMLKKENLKTNPVLFTTVAQRAFNTMAFMIVPEWCMNTVGHRWLRKNQIREAKHFTE